MQVDTEIGAPDDLLHKGVGELGGQGSPRAAGEAAVEIAAVRQIARQADEAVGVDHRDQDERSCDIGNVDTPGKLPHNLYTDDLVAMDRGAHEGDRTLTLCVQDLRVHVDLRVVGKKAQG